MLSKRNGTPPASTPRWGSRPIDPALHPIETGNYRVATPAIQAFSELINRCLRYRITAR